MADEDQTLNRLWPVKLFSTPLVNCIMTWHIVWRYVKMTERMNDLYSNYAGKWIEEVSVTEFRQRNIMAFFQSTGCFYLSCWVEAGLVRTDGMRSADTLLSLRAMSHVTHVWPGMSCPLRHKWSRKSASVTLFHFHLHPNVSECACMCEHMSLSGCPESLWLETSKIYTTYTTKYGKKKIFIYTEIRVFFETK